jgi:hypothetical protein
MNFAKRTTLTAMASIVLGSSGLMASTTASAKEVTVWAWDPELQHRDHEGSWRALYRQAPRHHLQDRRHGQGRPRAEAADARWPPA